ncbi:MAG TPA: thioesterase family protein [Coleofasciculaceae cyanobacterium]|jgi:predicted thioesterase
MKPGLQIGHQYEYTLQVREDMQAQFEQTVVHPLYATASMITHMEWAARQHILPYLEEGEEGVGYHVDVRHLKPTPIGAMVRIRSTVSGIEENKVSSLVEAWNETGKIGEGMLVQALVPLEKLYIDRPEAPPAKVPDETPSPAELVAIGGESRLTLEILKWEYGGLACTRYDEWLICRANLRTMERSEVFEGAFLLRYELEEWLSAIGEMIRNRRSAYQSDFLEPVLNVRMEASEPGEFITLLTFARPALSARMEVSQQTLEEFCRQLEAQCAGFPSRL